MVYINDANGAHMAGLAVSVSSSHSITIDSADGPYSSVNVMKEATGVSTLTQILTNKIDSDGYYAFRVKCGSATKWYYIKATT